jgi:hypothetical protein
LYEAFSSSLSSFQSLEISVILSLVSNCFKELLERSFLENKLYPELGGLSGLPSFLEHKLIDKVDSSSIFVLVKLVYTYV